MPPKLDALSRRVLQRHVDDAATRSGSLVGALNLMFPHGWSLSRSSAARIYVISGIASPKAEPIRGAAATAGWALESAHVAYLARYYP